MNGSIKVLPAHLKRLAVVYLRQSDPKQVRENRESAVNQRALTERLRELTWKPEQIIVIDADQGVSAKHAEGRAGFQKLVADVGLGKIGIIIGYEVSRLARNNADWHRLLELCALFDQVDFFEQDCCNALQECFLFLVVPKCKSLLGLTL